MLVVADSGPLHYLIPLDHAELLRRFYGRVAVPDAVATELISPGAPDAVRDCSRPVSASTRRSLQAVFEPWLRP